MEKLQSFLSQRACGCWKQAEKAVRLGPSETREENIILKGGALYRTTCYRRFLRQEWEIGEIL